MSNSDDDKREAKKKHLLNIHEVRRVFVGGCGWGALIQIN